MQPSEAALKTVALHELRTAFNTSTDPCHDCKHHSHCKTQKTACRDYATYINATRGKKVNMTKNRTPSKKYYC